MNQVTFKPFYIQEISKELFFTQSSIIRHFPFDRPYGLGHTYQDTPRYSLTISVPHWELQIFVCSWPILLYHIFFGLNLPVVYITDDIHTYLASGIVHALSMFLFSLLPTIFRSNLIWIPSTIFVVTSDMAHNSDQNNRTACTTTQ